MNARVAKLDSRNSFYSRLNAVGLPLETEPRASHMAIGPGAHALQAPGVTPVTTDSEAANIGDVDPDEMVTRAKSELETMSARDEGMTKAEDLQAGENCPHQIGVAGQGPQEARQS